MSADDAEVAFGELAHTRESAGEGARLVGLFDVASRIHVGCGDTLFCHVMEQVVPGRWELWRLATAQTFAVFALRAKAQPTRWLGAGTVMLDTSLAAFIPEAAAEEIQALEDDDVPVDFSLGAGEAGAETDGPSAGIVKTPGGSALGLIHLKAAGAHDVAKGLDARGLVCALAILGQVDG
jgi:hypothetical protein